MINMQVFHQWLSSTASIPSGYQRRLMSLARLGREQLLSASGDLGWEIWHAPKAAETCR